MFWTGVRTHLNLVYDFEGNIHHVNSCWLFFRQQPTAVRYVFFVIICQLIKKS